MKIVRTSVSILLSLMMIVSLFTIIPFEASAASGVQYIERSWDGSKVVSDTKTCTDYTLLANRSSDTLYSGWYVVDRDFTISGRLRVSGTVNLILCDGKTLTSKSGITVLENDTLNIFGQSQDKGKIYSHPTDDNDDFEMKDSAIIGGTDDDPNAGNIIIHGGTLDLDAPTCRGFFTGNDAACLGGGYKGTVKSVKVFGGDIKCKSVNGGAAIGGGKYGAPSNGEGLLIYGGKINAKAQINGGDSAAAIGSGYNAPHAAGTIRIYGGEITARASTGAAIGSGGETDSNNIVITGGFITATATTASGYSGAAIGSGKGGRAHGISISNAVVIAVSGSGAGIGSGEKGPANGVSVSKSIVLTASTHGGAGIGSGYKGDCGDINISDSIAFGYSKEFKSTDELVAALQKMGSANVPALTDKENKAKMETYISYAKAGLNLLGGLIYFLTPDHSGAAIGGGVGGDVDTISITRSNVVAVSENYSAGIGSGEDGDFGTITIKDSEIEATSGDYGAAIGSGDEAEKCGTITIDNSTVTASAGTDAAAIGTGNETDQTATINITGSTVTANGGRYAAGIGGGDAVSGGTINITDSTIKEAKSGTDGAGIGGGESGNGGNITIKGSTVTAHGGGYAAGIGGGDAGDGGNITINNSTVSAYGGTDAAGIGGGEDGDGGYITIKNESDVYADGNSYGAGIGGGEDAGVHEVSITSSCKVKAYAGGDGNGVAIGHGDYNKFAAAISGNYPSNGTLALYPKSMVEAGSNPSSTSTYTNDDIWKACRKNKYAYVHPCEHKTTYYQVANKYSHYKCCAYCGKQIDAAEPHSFGSDNKCTKCGSTTEIIKCTFIEQNNDGEVTRTTAAQNYTDWTIPSYAENVPDGMVFRYWQTEENGKTVIYPPGRDTVLYGDLTLKAVYVPGIKTTYIDENYEQENVTALRITKSNLSIDYSGWYIIDSESDLSSSDEITLNQVDDVNIDVNIIIADDADVTIKQIYSLRANASVSIFGQAKQTGKLTATSPNFRVRNYKQYGGNVHVYQLRADNDFIFACGTFESDHSAFGQNTMQFSWYRYNQDTIKIDSFSGAGTVKIADGKAFQNEREEIFKGTLTSSEVHSYVEGYTITPAAIHRYGQSTWVWSKDYSVALAIFECTEDGVDETFAVQGDITVDDNGHLRSYHATCTFNGKKYLSDYIRIEYAYKVTYEANDGGYLRFSGDTILDGKFTSVDVEPGNKVIIYPIAESGSMLKSLTAVRKDDGRKIKISDDNTFIMPECDVIVKAEFVSSTPKTEPYIDSDGEYHLGCIEHYEIDGRNYAVNEDGSVGEELDSVDLSYFDFKRLSDGTYQIKSYTGPMDKLEQLEIPKTFEGKAITVLGEENESFMKGTGTQSAFTLVLNKNVTTIQGNAFFLCKLTAVEGDTSGLNHIKDKPFVWANLAGDSKIDLKLDYPGRITVDSNAFGMENVTVRLKHATTLSSNGGASSVKYIITDDAHTYGEPVWTWSDDKTSATATFTCTDSRCKHVEEVKANVTRAESGDNTIYTATVVLNGETYTDVKGSYYIRIIGSEHGKVTADKAYADEGETVKLTATPDDNYMLKSITVKDANGKAVTVTNNSFVMPAGGATVSSEFTIKAANISVGGVSINVNNCSDILGDGTASYDFDTNTLTLTNADIEVTNGTGIRYNEKSDKPFTIVLNGENRIADDVDDGSRTCYGLALYAAATGFTISGSGTLDIEMSSTSPRVGIHARKAVTVDGVKVSVDVTGSENAVGVDLVYGDSVLKLENASRMEINAGGYAMQSNKNVKNLNVSDSCYFEAVSDTQALNENINLTDNHPTVIVNTEPSADGAENWDESTALTSYKYIRMRGEDAPYWVTIEKSQHGTVTASRNSAVEGETVKLTATPEDSYELEAYSVKDANGEAVTVTDNSFTMPASDVTITATFALNKYTVTWKNGDEVLETDENVPCGATPTYDGDTPTKASDENYGYIFKGWSPEISKVTGDVTYTAQFNQADYVDRVEPYIDEDGDYILGTVEHYEFDGKNYAVNQDGSVGEELDSIELSYFDFELLENDTYQIKHYTEPKDSDNTIDEIVIPDTFKGKAITVLGTGGLMDSFVPGTASISTLKLSKNITEVKQHAFINNLLSKVTGDTSNLKTIGQLAFGALLFGTSDNKLDIKLYYEGAIDNDGSIFGGYDVTLHLKHATKFGSDGIDSDNITYDFVDAHTYGEPEWTWADDYKSATATFTCTDARCNHNETVKASVSKSEETSKTVYTATAEFEGKPYTSTETVNKALSTVTITSTTNGTVTADKNKAYVGEEVTLEITPDAGYMLNTLTVKDSNNKDIPVSDNKFTMPDCNVTVTATFAANEYTITYNVGENGKVSGVRSANVGNDIELTITPNGGYELDTLSVKDSNNSEIEVASNKFTMPADNVTVEATFKKANYTITYVEPEHGTISGTTTAQFNDEVELTITPDEGYAIMWVSATDERGEEYNVEIIDNILYVPNANVTVSAKFIKTTSAAEPYIDNEGAYHLGNIEYVTIDGDKFAVKNDRYVGTQLDSVDVSYFDFKLINNDTEYQINYYTGPTDELNELVIPKTFNDKPITVLGNDINDAGDSKCRLVPQGTAGFTLKLNENITEIKPYTFYAVQVTDVTGDTSNLSKIGSCAFSWANSGRDYALDIKLDYPGKITAGYSIFNNMNVTARIKHATTFSRSLGQQSIKYLFTDAHIYGEPKWTWADDYSSATAKFTCTDSRCTDKPKTVEATVLKTEEISKTVYTATAEIGGKVYTVTKEVAKPQYNVAIANSKYGTVTADKSSAYAGEEVTLTVTPDEGCDFSSLSVKDENNNDITVTENKFIMPAGDVTVTAVFTIRKYTVTWKNGDEVLETDKNVHYGTIPVYDGETPTKEATAQYTYTFDGWSPEISEVTGDVTYTAVFTKTVNNYTVTWKNGDDVLETDEDVPYGATPTYDGETPTKAATAQYTYTFDDWSPEVSEVTGDVTYTAVFKETVNRYTVTWKNGDDVLETYENIPYGVTPAYTGATPAKEADDENHAYIFKGWSPEISAVTGDVTYTAQFAQATLVARTEPYIDSDGAYIVGTVEHYECDDKNYKVNEDGSVGDELSDNEIVLSYFDFSLINNTEYRINYFTGPTDNLTTLEIPQTYNGKAITVLGNDINNAENAKCRLVPQGTPGFTLVLNKNIKEIKPYTFYAVQVTDVTGDTSSLSKIGDYAFSWANSGRGYTLDIKLDYEGTITCGRSIFNNMKVTANIKHATKFSSTSFGAQNISYNFTDAHIYGAPSFTWADDYSSATATFTCTDTRCNHKETINASVTSEYGDGAPKYTATATFEGKTYTDVVTPENPLDALYNPSINAADALEMDKNLFALPSELVYTKAKLLGVQKKEAIKTDTAGTGMRFVAEISSEYVGKDGIDYGFEIVKTSKNNTAEFNTAGGFGIMQNLLNKNSSNIKSISCKDTSNNITGDTRYGDKNDTTTDYKYVTLAVNDIPDNQGIAVRFYVEIDGVRYYSGYTDSNGNSYRGCCASYATLMNALNVRAATPDEA